jgi:hypothetical protein
MATAAGSGARMTSLKELISAISMIVALVLLLPAALIWQETSAMIRRQIQDIAFYRGSPWWPRSMRGAFLDPLWCYSILKQLHDEAASIDERQKYQKARRALRRSCWFLVGAVGAVALGVVGYACNEPAP